MKYTYAYLNADGALVVVKTNWDMRGRGFVLVEDEDVFLNPQQYTIIDGVIVRKPDSPLEGGVST